MVVVIHRWLCIYPAYLNSRKTLSEGRRVPKSKAVDNPLCTEIRDVCNSQSLAVEFESNKHYSREPARDHIHSGRVRVQIRKDDGTPLNPSIASRKYTIHILELHDHSVFSGKELYSIICELIPKLKTRQGGKSASAEQGTGSGTSGGGGASAGGSKKKKGRRK